MADKDLNNSRERGEGQELDVSIIDEQKLMEMAVELIKADPQLREVLSQRVEKKAEESPLVPPDFMEESLKLIENLKTNFRSGEISREDYLNSLADLTDLTVDTLNAELSEFTLGRYEVVIKDEKKIDEGSEEEIVELIEEVTEEPIEEKKGWRERVKGVGEWASGWLKKGKEKAKPVIEKVNKRIEDGLWSVHEKMDELLPVEKGEARKKEETLLEILQETGNEVWGAAKILKDKVVDIARWRTEVEEEMITGEQVLADEESGDKLGDAKKRFVFKKYKPTEVEDLEREYEPEEELWKPADYKELLENSKRVVDFRTKKIRQEMKDLPKTDVINESEGSLDLLGEKSRLALKKQATELRAKWRYQESWELANKYDEEVASLELKRAMDEYNESFEKYLKEQLRFIREMTRVEKDIENQIELIMSGDFKINKYARSLRETYDMSNIEAKIREVEEEESGIEDDNRRAELVKSRIYAEFTDEELENLEDYEEMMTRISSWAKGEFCFDFKIKEEFEDDAGVEDGVFTPTGEEEVFIYKGYSIETGDEVELIVDSELVNKARLMDSVYRDNRFPEFSYAVFKNETKAGDISNETIKDFNKWRAEKFKRLEEQLIKLES